MLHRSFLILLTVVVLGSTITSLNAQGYNGESVESDYLRAAQDQDLDSFWLDQSTWLQYGYRPHVQAHAVPFTNVPAYSPKSDFYVYGNAPQMPTGLNPLEKSSIQMTKLGTWH